MATRCRTLIWRNPPLVACGLAAHFTPKWGKVAWISVSASHDPADADRSCWPSRFRWLSRSGWERRTGTARPDRMSSDHSRSYFLQIVLRQFNGAGLIRLRLSANVLAGGRLGHFGSPM